MFGLVLGEEYIFDHILWIVVSLLEPAYKISAIETINVARKKELRKLLFPDDAGCFIFYLFIKFIRPPSTDNLNGKHIQ